MNMRITKAPAGGSIRAIASKSAAHRYMIAAAMSGISLTDHMEGLSRDITATKDCLQALRKAQGEEEGSRQDPAMKMNPAAAMLPCGESGSTLRFLIPLAGVLGIESDFLCEGRLPDRPMDAFLEQLAQNGCQVSGRNPKHLTGKLRGGDFVLPGDISSQYVTGLLMALPLAEEDSQIFVQGVLQSRPYIDLTLEVLDKAGITVREFDCEKIDLTGPDPSSETRRNAGSVGAETPSGVHKEAGPTEPESVRSEHEEALQEHDDKASAGAEPEEAVQAGHNPLADSDDTAQLVGTLFIIPGGQKYALPDEDLLNIEGDWSNGAFWLVMDAMNRARGKAGIACTGLREDSRQGDKAITRIIREMEAADGPDFISLDVADIPDLVPAIAVLAVSRPEGACTQITGARRLRFKESDRLHTVTQTLNALGASISEEEEGLRIPGQVSLRGGEVSSCNDHRIAMMAAAASCISQGTIILQDAQAVEKSYPHFFEDFAALGGQAEIL